MTASQTDDRCRHTYGDEAEVARFRLEAGRILGSSLDFESTLRQVADLAVPRIADWCAVELLGDDDVLVQLALAHQDPTALAIVDELRRTYPADPTSDAGSYAVVRSGAPILVAEVTEEMLAAAATDAHHAELLARLGLRSYLAVPLRAAGRVLGVLTIASDRSGRRFGPHDVAAVENLADHAAVAIDNARAFRSADRFRHILDAIAEAVFVIEPANRRITDVNHGATQLTGLDRDQLIGHPMWDLVEAMIPHQAMTSDQAAHLADPLLEGRVGSRTVSLMFRHAAGHGVPVEVLLQRIDLPGEPAGLVAIARDTRERIDAQARLLHLAEAERTRAAELHTVIRTIGDGVVVCDAVGRITLANPAGQDLFPAVSERTYAEILAELHDPDGVAPTLGFRGGPITLPSKRDRDRWIELATYPVKGTSAGAPGTSDETIVVLRDVTEGRRREAVRETLVGVLSHELRTPITTIYGGAKLLSRANSTLDDTTRRAIFADIADEAEHLQRLVEDLVALNRFGDDAGDLGREPVLLQRLAPQVVGSEESRWPGVTFRVTMPPGLPTVVGDPTYVEQVLRNLISNAAKYGGAEASVDVALEAADDEVHVRVLDDGPGIEPGEVDRLFELFFRSPNTAGSGSGAGIGLFVCSRLVRAMGGRVWARPRPAGGSEFGFALRIMTPD